MVALQDLTFVDENPDTFNLMINFDKQRMVYGIISDALRFQNSESFNIEYPHMEEVATFIERLPRLGDKVINDFYHLKNRKCTINRCK